jgi:pimeloyl-ACP methyl ester carboxylesterase
MHGWLDNAASFVPLMPHLREFDIVALDLPGHGASAHRAEGYDYAFVDWIHDALDALDALGWKRARLLGHSMGAAIATMVAASAPERVEKLAVIEALGPLAGAATTAGERLRGAVTARRTAAQRPRRVIPKLEMAVKARLAVELGVAQGWHRYVGDAGDVLAVGRFGASAPADVLLKEYGFTVDAVIARARPLLAG